MITKAAKTFAAVFIMAAFLTTGLTSCSASDKVFEKAGFTITLTSAFTEKDLVSVTAYYESTNTIVTALKEEIAVFEQSGFTGLTLKDYGDLVIKQNQLNKTLQQKDGLNYFTYEKQVSGKEFSYLAVVFQGSDAFWLINFACETKNYSKTSDDFFKWAGSITVR